MAIEYAPTSIKPKGVKSTARGFTCAMSGFAVAIAENAKPVEYAENNPHTTPKPGMNIGIAIVVLCAKIPIPSIVSTIESKKSIIS